MAIEKIQLNMFGLPEEKSPIYEEVNNNVYIIYPSLPYETIFKMIQWAVNHIMDDRSFISGPLCELISDLALVKFYTNIDLDAIDLGDFNIPTIYEWYDILQEHGIIATIKEKIDPQQRDFFFRTLEKTLKSLVDYRNSAVGVLEKIQTLSINANDSMAEAIHLMEDPTQLEALKRMVELMTVPASDSEIPSENK